MSARVIYFGYPVGGLVVELVIQRTSDQKFWGPSGWQTGVPSPALLMSYDATMRQYYSEELPTSQCTWTAIQQNTNQPIYFGEYGGGFPEVTTPPSATTYTMQELIDRVRVEIRDPSGNLYTDAELLLMMDSCAEWIMNQCLMKKATLGVKPAQYVGDGTTEWGLPADFLGLHTISNPNLMSDEGMLVHTSKASYDAGMMGRGIVGTRYYARVGSNIYFINDLADGDVVNMIYYYRLTKLTSSDLAPFDGHFMALMHHWVVTKALTADEFSAGFEKEMLSMFMNIAQSHMRSSGPKRRVSSANVRDFRGKSCGGVRSRRGRVL